MGWASKLEDDIRRWDASRIGFMERVPEKDDLAYAAYAREARRLLKEATDIMADVRELLELATDPDLKLADEVISLRIARRESKERTAALKSELADCRIKLRDEHDTRKRAERKAKKAEAALEEFLRRYPTAAYDAYSTDAQLRKHKSGL